MTTTTYQGEWPLVALRLDETPTCAGCKALVAYEWYDSRHQTTISYQLTSLPSAGPTEDLYFVRRVLYGDGLVRSCPTAKDCMQILARVPRGHTLTIRMAPAGRDLIHIYTWGLQDEFAPAARFGFVYFGDCDRDQCLFGDGTRREDVILSVFGRVIAPQGTPPPSFRGSASIFTNFAEDLVEDVSWIPYEASDDATTSRPYQVEGIPRRLTFSQP